MNCKLVILSTTQYWEYKTYCSVMLYTQFADAELEAPTGQIHNQELLGEDLSQCICVRRRLPFDRGHGCRNQMPERRYICRCIHWVSPSQPWHNSTFVQPCKTFHAPFLWFSLAHISLSRLDSCTFSSFCSQPTARHKCHPCLLLVTAFGVSSVGRAWIALCQDFEPSARQIACISHCTAPHTQRRQREQIAQSDMCSSWRLTKMTLKL